MTKFAVAIAVGPDPQEIDRTADLPPVVANSAASTPGNEPLPVTLQATDPENNPITFAIADAPLHGVIENFNPLTGTFTYVPNYGYVGLDTIEYTATDSKLAQSTATLSITVTPVNQAPVASDESANAIAVEQALAVLQRAPAALITDIDGTISHIVSRPEDAVVGLYAFRTGPGIFI